MACRAGRAEAAPRPPRSAFPPSRSTPRARDRIGRTGAGSDIGGKDRARGRPGSARGCSGHTLGDPACADRRLEQRVAGEAIRAVQTGGGGLSASPQAQDAAAPGCVHGDAAHVIMRSRSDRDRLRGGIEPGGAADRGDVRETARESRAGRARASRNTRWPCRSCRQTARATTSRGSSSARPSPAMKRFPVSSISTAPSPRTASLISGMGYRPMSSAVGWNCTNSRSANAAPARAARISPCPVEPAGLVVCWNNPPTPPVAITTRLVGSSNVPEDAAARTPATAPSCNSSRRASTPSSTVMQGVARTASDQRAHDLLPGSVARSVNDPPPAMGCFETETERSARSRPVEAHAVPREQFDRRGRGAHDALSRARVTQPIPGGKCVGEVKVEGVVLAERCSDASLRPRARCLHPERRLAQQQRRLRGQCNAVRSPARPPPMMIGAPGGVTAPASAPPRGGPWRRAPGRWSPRSAAVRARRGCCRA